ncbi:MAG: glycosyltransferase family 9 protein [Chlamydiia bacterium]|nr:glycosyltransferase family 9 protein [Chlamydiia bacterium]
MKNKLIRGLLTLAPSKKFERKGEPRILIVSTTGLGDSLWGTPAIRALRMKYPQATLSLLTSPIGAQVFQNNPHLNEIFTLKDPALMSSCKLLKTLRKKAFDTALIFHLSQRPVLPLVTLAGPAKIVGTTGINKGLDHLLTDPLPQTKTHEIQRRLEIAGCPEASPEMELFLTEDENHTALSHLPDAPLVIGMHPGAKDKFKQWDPKHFVELGRKLAQEKGATLLITGDRSEAPLAEQIAQAIPHAHSVAGKLPVRVTAALIEKLSLFITNDTGPMHLAFAMGTPTLALFSPTDPRLCGPYKISHGTVLQKPRTCTPCIRKKCRSPFCMEQISPQEAYEAIFPTRS